MVAIGPERKKPAPAHPANRLESFQKKLPKIVNFMAVPALTSDWRFYKT